MEKDDVQRLQEKSLPSLAQIHSSHDESIARKLKRIDEKMEQLRTNSVLNGQEIINKIQERWNELQLQMQEETNLNKQKRIEKT